MYFAVKWGFTLNIEVRQRKKRGHGLLILLFDNNLVRKGCRPRQEQMVVGSLCQCAGEDIMALQMGFPHVPIAFGVPTTWIINAIPLSLILLYQTELQTFA
ncbi:hypothetical protein PanWU01x14_336850 [Parasponia andersonii]|uniref:Uncharacterized protein n=1 Tax=Parasponia andersonii TaxID=3476 RepID=A0A2P5AFT6_PARAD|nr:hypothetical protein PanWU01x14_336850 [Parasponia andersonii]